MDGATIFADLCVNFGKKTNVKNLQKLANFILLAFHVTESHMNSIKISHNHHLFLLKLFCVYKTNNFFRLHSSSFTFYENGIGLENFVVCIFILKYAIEKN